MIALRHLLIPISVLVILPTGLAAQEDVLDNIRKLYYQKESLDSIQIISNKVIPSLGEQFSTSTFYYKDCGYMDCEVDGLNVALLRKVTRNKSVNTSSTRSEFLFNDNSEVVFYYRFISSEDYFYESGRECAEERYYISAGSAILVRITSCSDYEFFDPIEYTQGFPETITRQLNHISSASKRHLDTFNNLIQSD